MCIPMAAAAIAMMAVSTATAAYGAVKTGDDAKQVADYNANAQKQTAISVENQGAQQALDAKQKARVLLGKQSAAAAGGGIVGSTGSALDLSTQTAGYGELDALRITNNAQRSAWGYQTQAGIDEFQGSNSQTAGYIGAGSSILGGASSAAFGGIKAGYWGKG